MKEEEWREWLKTGYVRLGRYYISDIVGWTKRYNTNPGANCFESKGQLVFATNTCTVCTFLGQCVNGQFLIPSGVSCSTLFTLTAPSGFCTCGFCIGTGTYVALGAVCGCGATLWRKIN